MTEISRRQALATMATVGTAVWAIPEILTAKPAGGATLSAPGQVLPLPITTTTLPPVPVQSEHAANPLAFTGLNIERDAEVGAALIAGGWVLHHWTAKRGPNNA
jgi:hypothetical protein